MNVSIAALNGLIFGYRTLQAAGVALAQRTILNFAEGFALEDDELTGATKVRVAAGPSSLSFSGQARGNLIARGASAWQLLTQSTTAGHSLLSGGAGADNTWGYPPDLNIASQARGDLLRRGTEAWQRLQLGASGKVLKSDGTDPAWGDISVIAGDGGVATITCPQVRWGSGDNKGLLSIWSDVQTTTNTANQTLLTVGLGTTMAYDVYTRVVATDTGASGVYRAHWADDLFARRTGTDYGNGSGVAARIGSAPSAANPKSVGSLTGASFDVALSTNNLLVRGSPGTPGAANITWQLETIILMSPLA